MTLTGMKSTSAFWSSGARHHEEDRARAELPAGPRRLEEETAWLESTASAGTNASTSLDKVVAELTRKEKNDERKNRK